MLPVVCTDAAMDYYIECEPVSLLLTPRMVAGEWYLRGFVDAYDAHVALIPAGPAGEQYSRGYQQGLAAVQRDFFAAMCIHPVVLETVGI